MGGETLNSLKRKTRLLIENLNIYTNSLLPDFGNNLT
jgi:hypothetical protein